jgi:predicted PurR-regulated permease PerM
MITLAKRSNDQLSKIFFGLVAIGVIYLFWQMLQPFVLTLITAGIFTILFSSWHDKIRVKIRSRGLAAFFMIFFVAGLIVLPLGLLAVIIFQQATDVLQSGFIERTILNLQEFRTWQIYETLPENLRQAVESVDVGEATRFVINWLRSNIGSIIAGGAVFTVQLFLFFIFLFYFFLNKDEIRQEIVELSPFRDKLDQNIIERITNTILAVVKGAILVAMAQALMATIGLFIFGVPKAFLWGSLVLIAAQIPMVGVSLIMLPAVLYLIGVGSGGAAIGLLIWSLTAVGLIDNLLSPMLVGRKAQMPELLVMIAILGGLQVFGAIGFILGPVILAMLLVLRDLYKDGILKLS